MAALHQEVTQVASHVNQEVYEQNVVGHGSMELTAEEQNNVCMLVKPNKGAVLIRRTAKYFVTYSLDHINQSSSQANTIFTDHNMSPIHGIM